MSSGGEDLSMLRGLRVIDFTRVLAGPYCTQILGDLGAEVIKIEEPGRGDEVRNIPPFYPGGESHYFLSLNRNKRSVVVDLKTSEGRQFVLELIRHADVVVENFRPGVLDRLGLSLNDLQTVKPDIILCSISGYGTEGAMSTAPAFDLVIQARSGAMSVNGDGDRPPTKLGLPVGDLGGGMWATIAILAALQRRPSVSHAQHIDISLLDGLIALQGYLNQIALLTGDPPARLGSDHHNVVPYGRFRAKDGYLVIAILISPFWSRFCDAIGKPELANDVRFETNVARKENREELQSIINEILAGRTRSEWGRIFAESDVPCGPVLNVVEALNQDVVATRGLIRSIEHPTAGTLSVVGSPIHVDGMSLSREISPPPLLGEHTRAAALELAGLTTSQTDDLVRRGVISEYQSPLGDAEVVQGEGVSK